VFQGLSIVLEVLSVPYSGFVGEDIKGELDLVALAELSNHTYCTFNHAYASTTTLTKSPRASES